MLSLEILSRNSRDGIPLIPDGVFGKTVDKLRGTKTMEEGDQYEGFKVKDKRRFTQESETKEAQENREPERVREEPPAAEKEAPKMEERAPHPMDFSTLVLSLANTALFQLGFLKTPETGDAGKDLQGARQTIDLLGLLEEKTRGNLTEQEEKVLKDTLFQLRMAFVEASK
jgi:hypothetical protein